MKAEGRPLPPAGPQAPKARAGGLPSVYRSPVVRSATRTIRAAFARMPRDLHYLRLTDREFLHVYYSVEHDRSRTRKAIGKGLAHPQDLRASDSLWQALQAIMGRRMKGCRP